MKYKLRELLFELSELLEHEDSDMRIIDIDTNYDIMYVSDELMDFFNKENKQKDELLSESINAIEFLIEGIENYFGESELTYFSKSITNANRIIKKYKGK